MLENLRHHLIKIYKNFMKLCEYCLSVIDKLEDFYFIEIQLMLKN